MKKATAKKWSKALRSGKYEQTREVLKRGQGYCCLGVLLEETPEFEFIDGYWSTSDPNVIKHYRDEKDVGDFEEINKLIVEDEEYPDWLRSWFGMEEQEHRKFIKLNDDKCLTFPEIADVVEHIYLNVIQDVRRG